jgi:hypothetical protein
MSSRINGGRCRLVFTTEPIREASRTQDGVKQVAIQFLVYTSSKFERRTRFDIAAQIVKCCIA